MQTILGAGGAIGNQLASQLTKHTNQIKLVSRNPAKVNETDILHPADLTSADQVSEAVKGTEIAYLTAGLKYDTKVWASTWPLIMENVLKACETHQTKLVFFDNVYMYDPESIGMMTESNPINPQSEKGKIRERIAQMLMDEVEKGKIEALIARSADFYGPGIKNVSMLTETVFKPLSQGKKANCLGRVDLPHSFTFTPDAGKATAILGNTPEAYGQVWHLPTAPDPPTMKEFIELIASELGAKPAYRVAGKTAIRVMGWFIPIMKEMVEMLYQYQNPYVFNSDKFESRFAFTPTGYREGIRMIVEQDYR